MPRRNRNAGAIRPDLDQLTTDLYLLSIDLHHQALSRSGKSCLLAVHLPRTRMPGDLLTVPDGKHPRPYVTAGSR